MKILYFSYNLNFVLYHSSIRFTDEQIIKVCDVKIDRHYTSGSPIINTVYDRKLGIHDSSKYCGTCFLIGDNTCDPKYSNPKGPECYNAIKNFCLNGDNLFTQNVCKTWCSANPNECEIFKKDYCDTYPEVDGI